MPDLALGCLMKPYTEEDLVRALKTAEDILKGRERLRPSRPDNLTIYSAAGEAAPPQREMESFLPEPAAIAARPSLKARLASWLGA
jgi:hypothetical protein